MEHLKFRQGEARTLLLGGLSEETTVRDLEVWASQVPGEYDVEFAAGVGQARVFVQPVEAALALLRRTWFIKGTKIEVRVMPGGELLASDNLDKQRRRVFINGLPPETRDYDLRKALGSRGELRSLYTVKGNINNKTLCYAEFVHKSNAKKAIKQGIFFGRKKYRVYKYRTLDQLQKNFDNRQEQEISNNSDSQSSDGSDNLFEYRNLILKTSLPKKSSKGHNSLKRTQSCQQIKNHYIKPNSKAYFIKGFDKSPTFDNPLFRLNTPSNKMTFYKKIEIDRAFVYIRLRKLSHTDENQAEMEKKSTGMSQFSKTGLFQGNNTIKG